MDGTVFLHGGYTVRRWKTADRDAASKVVKVCLEAYGLSFEPEGADLDAIEVERHYQRGEFWVVVEEGTSKLIGTAAYYEVEDKGNGGSRCVEIRKMYLLPEARGKKLGQALLKQLEEAIIRKGYQKIIVETATVLHEACQLYQSSGYLPLEGVETERCDRRLYKDVASGDLT